MSQNFELSKLLEESQRVIKKLKEVQKQSFLNSLEKNKVEETLFFMDNFLDFYFKEIQGYQQEIKGIENFTQEVFSQNNQQMMRLMEQNQKLSNENSLMKIKLQNLPGNQKTSISQIKFIKIDEEYYNTLKDILLNKISLQQQNFKDYIELMNSQQQKQQELIEDYIGQMNEILSSKNSSSENKLVIQKLLLCEDDKNKELKKVIEEKILIEQVYNELSNNVRKFLSEKNLLDQANFRIQELDFILKNKEFFEENKSTLQSSFSNDKNKKIKITTEEQVDLIKINYYKENHSFQEKKIKCYEKEIQNKIQQINLLMNKCIKNFEEKKNLELKLQEKEFIIQQQEKLLQSSNDSQNNLDNFVKEIKNQFIDFSQGLINDQEQYTQNILQLLKNNLDFNSNNVQNFDYQNFICSLLDFQKKQISQMLTKIDQQNNNNILLQDQNSNLLNQVISLEQQSDMTRVQGILDETKLLLENKKQDVDKMIVKFNDYLQENSNKNQNQEKINNETIQKNLNEEMKNSLQQKEKEFQNKFQDIEYDLKQKYQIQLKQLEKRNKTLEEDEKQISNQRDLLDELQDQVQTKLDLIIDFKNKMILQLKKVNINQENSELIKQLEVNFGNTTMINDSMIVNRNSIEQFKKFLIKLQQYIDKMRDETCDIDFYINKIEDLTEKCLQFAIFEDLEQSEEKQEIKESLQNQIQEKQEEQQQEQTQIQEPIEIEEKRMQEEQENIIEEKQEDNQKEEQMIENQQDENIKEENIEETQQNIEETQKEEEKEQMEIEEEKQKEQPKEVKEEQKKEIKLSPLQKKLLELKNKNKKNQFPQFIFQFFSQIFIYLIQLIMKSCVNNLLIIIFCYQITYSELINFPYYKQFTSQNDQNCQHSRKALFIEKPVYKQGEQINIYLYQYNLTTKQPLSYCQSYPDENITLYDSQDKEIGKALLNKEFNKDKSVLLYTFEIPKTIFGGSYYCSLKNDYKEKVKFFILDYQEKTIGIIGDWNLDVIKPEDDLQGKISIQTLTQEFDSYKNISYDYKFLNNEKLLIQKENKNLKNSEFKINFEVPKNFSNLLIFQLRVNLDGIEINYFKEFREAMFDDIIIEFNKGNQFLVIDYKNPIYFQCFKNKEKKEVIEIKDSDIIKNCGNDTQQINKISTQFHGKGKFLLEFTKSDIENKCQFYLQVNYDKFNQKQYLISNLQEESFSEVLMTFEQKYLNKEKIQVQFQTQQFEGTLLLILQQYNQVLIQKTFEMKIQDDKNQFQIEELDLNDLQNSGVYEVLLQRKMNDKEKNIKFKDKKNWETNYEGKTIQSNLIFLKPQKIIKPKINFDKENYQAGDEVNFKIDLQNCENCSTNENFSLLLTAINSSVFLEINEENTSPNLLTKVFLEKEVVNTKNKMLFWNQYLQGYYEENLYSKDQDMKLELLLGNQKERLEEGFLQKHKGLSEELKIVQKYINLNSNDRVYTMMMDDEAMPMMKGMRKAPLKMGAVPNEMKIKKKGKTIKNTEKTKEKSQQNSSIDKIQDISTIFQRFYNNFIDKNLIGNFKMPENKSISLTLIGIVFNEKGEYGYIKQNMLSKSSFNFIVDKPFFIFNENPFYMQIRVENNTTNNEQITFESPQHYNLEIESNSHKTFKMSFHQDQLPFKISANQNNQQIYIDEINPQVIYNGIQKTISQSKYLSKNSNKIILQQQIQDSIIQNSQSMKICYTNSTISLILQLLKQFNKIPCGCFEQASSQNFPLVIALKILMRTNNNLELKKQMIDNLKKGIKLLMGYETNTGGFEWFGKSPGHATLSAYGLWQFDEIQQLNLDLIDDQLFERLKKFFEKIQKQDGGYQITSGLDALGNPNQQTSDLYVSYILIKKYKDFQKQFLLQKQHILNIYEKIKNQNEYDSYKLALIGMFLLQLDQKNEAIQILEKLLQRQNNEGMIQQGKNSITNSKGNYLQIETTALTLLFLIEIDINSYAEQFQKGMSYLIKNFNKGFFGSTQGTILSLMVFDKYFENFYSQDNDEDINLNVLLNNEQYQEIKFKNTIDEIQCFKFDDLNEKIQNNLDIIVEQNVSIQSSKLISLEFQYYTDDPQNESELLKFDVKKQFLDDMLNYQIELINNSDSEQGMVIIEMNLPTCGRVDLNTLEQLKNGDFIDFYEIRNHNSKLVFYYRGLKINEKKSFSFSLLKQFKFQNCEKTIHQAYLYYQEKSSVYSTVQYKQFIRFYLKFFCLKRFLQFLKLLLTYYYYFSIKGF